MAEPDFAKYYDLETYLFEEVSSNFQRDKRLSTFDFFCIIIWKANRSKSRVARRLLKKHSDLDSAVDALMGGIIAAGDAKARLRVLISDYGFRLPIASAVLAVLYPDDFAIYDGRVCQVLRDFADTQDITRFDALWARYSQYMERVKAEVPDRASLREKDRYLWGKSFQQQLQQDIASQFHFTDAGNRATRTESDSG